MKKSLAFSEAIQSIFEIELNLIPQKQFVRYRSEYQLILSQIYLSNHREVEVSVNGLINNLKLGSQPTISKRISELEGFQFIQSQKSPDQRVRSFKITERGEQYLEQCAKVCVAIYAGCVEL